MHGADYDGLAWYVDKVILDGLVGRGEVGAFYPWRFLWWPLLLLWYCNIYTVTLLHGVRR